MEQTPLQRYQRAYHLHYSENKPGEAGRMYRELVETYPGSDVAVYASTQLSALKQTEPADDEPLSVHRHVGIAVGIVLTVLNLLLTGAVITMLVLNNNSVKSSQQGMSKVVQAMGKFYAGREQEALSILNDAKVISRADIAPYAISAEIYCRNHDYKKARLEYEMFDRLYPGLNLSLREIRAISAEEDAYVKAIKNQQMQQDSLINKESKKSVSQTQAAPYREPKKEPPPKVINTNDVSYF